MQKNGKFQGVTVNLTENPEGELQENRYPQQGGTIFSGKAQFLVWFVSLNINIKQLETSS